MSMREYFAKMKAARLEKKRQAAVDRVTVIGPQLRSMRADQIWCGENGYEDLELDLEVQHLVEERNRLLDFIRDTAQEG